MEVDGAHTGKAETQHQWNNKLYSGTLRESMEEEDHQEIPGGETLLLRWR
jgi:hypothetical protein